MLTTSNVFDRELRKAISAVVAEQKDTIALGNLQSMEQYKEAIGVIRGLNRALELCDEVSSKMASDNY